MKKKLVKMLSLMMAAVLVLGCTACGNAGGDTAETGNEAAAEADDAGGQHSRRMRPRRRAMRK